MPWSGKRGGWWATSEGHRAQGWCLNTAQIPALNGRLCGQSPASSDPQQLEQQGLAWKMLLVLPKSHSVCQTLPLGSSVPWPEEVDGVREGKGLQWTEEAGKEFHFPNLSFMTISRQCVLLQPALSLRAPQPIMPQWRADIQEWTGLENPPVKQPLVFPCPVCTKAV